MSCVRLVICFNYFGLSVLLYWWGCLFVGCGCAGLLCLVLGLVGLVCFAACGCLFADSLIGLVCASAVVVCIGCGVCSIDVGCVCLL